MRGVRLQGPGSAVLDELPDPVPTDGEVVLDVSAAAICGTDRKLTRRGVPVGRVLGHEVVGRTPGGVLVGVHPDTGCGRCGWCVRGWSNRCADRVAVGIDRDGGLAQRVVVPLAHTVEITGVDPMVAPLLEPLACGVHAVALAEARDVQRAAVVGAGAMGVLTMWALQARGVSVTVVQRSEQRRQLAAELGADEVVGPDSDLAGLTPDLVVVTAPGSAPLSWALERVAVGGTVHAFAGTPGGADVDATLVHYRHLRLLGSTGSGLEDYREAVRLQREGHVDLRALPVERVLLDDAPAVLTTDPDPCVLRTIVDLSEEAV